MPDATLNGGEFKRLVDAVKRFPSIGSFLGSDLINLEVGKKHAVASTFGVVVSRASIPAEGDLTLSAVDERALVPFTAICRPKSAVVIRNTEKLLQFRTRGREISSPIADGKSHVIRPLEGSPHMLVTEDLAKKVAYLAQIAMNDSSRPELCCVMLYNGQIMACDQKAVAVLKCLVPLAGRVALPLTLAKAIQKGDLLYTGAKETVLVSGIGKYAVPSPIKAQKDFPVDKLMRLATVEKTTVALVNGSHLKSALEECGACLGNIARNEVVVQLKFGNGKLELWAQNGGIKFRRRLPVKEKTAAELNLPLDEALHAANLFEASQVTVSKGQNGETFLTMKSGWCLFPRWKAK